MGRFLRWAWNDLRDDFTSLDGGKVMGGIVIAPVFFGVAYELLKAVGLQN